MQLSDGQGVDVLFHLPSIGRLPAALVNLIKTTRLAGVKIDHDLKKLSHDYPAAGLRHHLDDGSTLIPRANIIELSSLCIDVLRCPPKACQSLKAVFELCEPGKELNKELCGPVWKVKWATWPLPPPALQYALNDASASARAALRLLHPPRLEPSQQPPVPTAPPASPPPMPSAGRIAAGAAAFRALPTEVQQDVAAGSTAAAPPPIQTDEEEAAADEATHGAEAAAGDASPVDAATQRTVLQAAINLIDAWADVGDPEPLVLPTFLTSDDRGSLHDHCEGLGLAHETVGKDASSEERALHISRRAGDGIDGGGGFRGLGADMMARLKFRDAWVELLIKCDPHLAFDTHP